MTARRRKARSEYEGVGAAVRGDPRHLARDLGLAGGRRPAPADRGSRAESRSSRTGPLNAFGLGRIRVGELGGIGRGRSRAARRSGPWPPGAAQRARCSRPCWTDTPHATVRDRRRCLGSGRSKWSRTTVPFAASMREKPSRSGCSPPRPSRLPRRRRWARGRTGMVVVTAIGRGGRWRRHAVVERPGPPRTAPSPTATPLGPCPTGDGGCDAVSCQGRSGRRWRRRPSPTHIAPSPHRDAARFIADVDPRLHRARRRIDAHDCGVSVRRPYRARADGHGPGEVPHEGGEGGRCERHDRAGRRAGRSRGWWRAGRRSSVQTRSPAVGQPGDGRTGRQRPHHPPAARVDAKTRSRRRDSPPRSSRRRTRCGPAARPAGTGCRPTRGRRSFASSTATELPAAAG